MLTRLISTVLPLTFGAAFDDRGKNSDPILMNSDSLFDFHLN